LVVDAREGQGENVENQWPWSDVSYAGLIWDNGKAGAIDQGKCIHLVFNSLNGEVEKPSWSLSSVPALILQVLELQGKKQ